KAQQAHGEHDGERFHERALELPRRIRHGGRLVGDALELHAMWKLGLDFRHFFRDGLAEVHDIAVVGHDDAEHEYLLAVVAHGVRGRVLVAARDRREVADLYRPATDRDR